VGLQTNGRRLAEAGFARSLAAAGLTDVHLTLLGADAAVHDYHTGVAGSFAALSAGLAAAREAGLTAVAATVVTRSNFRVLSGMPGFLRASSVAAWLLEFPRWAGRAASGFDRVVPRFGLALPFALHALNLALKLPLPAWIRGAPLCALGPYAARSLPDAPRAFGEVCAACPARAGCCGADAVYLQRFSDGELSARPAVEPAGADPLAQLFVGTGELLLPAPGKVEPSPAAVRAALPQLGKVKPAALEATPGQPKKSGDELKEIFPELFEPR
jgi:hypothetical protein